MMIFKIFNLEIIITVKLKERNIKLFCNYSFQSDNIILHLDFYLINFLQSLVLTIFFINLNFINIGLENFRKRIFRNKKTHFVTRKCRKHKGKIQENMICGRKNQYWRKSGFSLKMQT